MPVSRKFPVVTRRIAFEGDGIFSPSARAEAFAGMALSSIREIDAENDAILGRDVQYEMRVNSRPVPNFYGIKETDTLSAHWRLGSAVAEFILATLRQAGPVLKGDYRASATMYVDGVESEDPSAADPANEILFLSTVPYARKIERGKKGYAPGAVYQAVAALAKARFSNMALIKFTYAQPEGAAPMLDAWARRNASRQGSARKQRAQLIKNRRQPAIVVYLR